MIMAQKPDYALIAPGDVSNNMTIKEYVRKRIKLQDKKCTGN